MNLFTRNSPHYHLPKYLLFLFTITNDLLEAKYVLNLGRQIKAFYFKPRVKANFI